VRNSSTRLSVFGDLLRNLTVAMSEDGPKLYKPAMLACVVEAIEDGSLAANEISFDFIAPRFIKKMRGLGVEATEENAAQPFFHLSGDMFWLHAVKNTSDPMRAENVGPAAARAKVKHALLKEPFWKLLQDPDARRRALEVLDEAWLRPKSKTRFWWVNQGKSFGRERPGEYIQAPGKLHDGESIRPSWNRVSEVRPGDIIVHYSRLEIRAFSVVQSVHFMVSAEPGEKDPDRPRVRVTTQYYDLPTTIALEQLASLRSLRGRHLPIDKDGFVKQAYLCILTPEGFAEILSLIPEASIPSPFQQYRQKSEPISSQRAMLTDKFVEKAAEDIRKSGFKVTDAMFRRFITALLAKPFVILTGTSGTGKTQLALKFAQWLVGREKYQLVAVGADWTDNRQVLGH